MKSPLSPSMAKFILDVRYELGYYNSYSRTIALLFLKYFIENSDDTSSCYEEILDFKTKMNDVAEGKYEFTLDDYDKFLQTIDLKYCTFFDYTFSFCDCYKFYFDMFQKKESDRKIFKSLIAVDLPTTPKEWEETLKFILASSETDMMRTQENTSSDSLTKIAAALLKVNNNDVYLDPFCGFSTSLLNIKNPKEYIGFDITYENMLISFATALFLGFDYKQINVIFGNFIKADDVVADKIFAEPPLLLKNIDLPKCYEKITKDFGVASLIKIYDSLKDGGTAVIATPSRTLSASQKGYEYFRKIVTENGLKAVINLPSLWGRSLVDTNLILIQKGYKGNIEFISTKESFCKDRGRFVATDELINKIDEVIIKQITEEEFSVSVERTEVLSKGNWNPNIYLAPTIKTQESRTVEEIDTELSALYQQFFNNNK